MPQRFERVSQYVNYDLPRSRRRVPVAFGAAPSHDGRPTTPGRFVFIRASAFTVDSRLIFCRNMYRERDCSTEAPRVYVISAAEQVIVFAY
ncbi:outer membrane receptor proteins, mostly Fe transport [Microbacterium testaceum StLB037]|uniref:Outer membrane receptor proteins, mostly Fe transport n=1 Tax=Microbacterium testaceum (strain StLB037) TaxID=979556 RepID=E8N6Z2_MICTS|nr:outer membrane receptor proteins, mostly Fe transport [Microbacterium testaceum StLB037]